MVLGTGHGAGNRTRDVTTVVREKQNFAGTKRIPNNVRLTFICLYHDLTLYLKSEYNILYPTAHIVNIFKLPNDGNNGKHNYISFIVSVVPILKKKLISVVLVSCNLDNYL